MNAYFVSATLYAALAALAVGGGALVRLGIVDSMPGLVWLRAHVVTLGVVAQLAFGVASGVLERRDPAWNHARRIGVWLALNAGLAVLLVAVPLLHEGLMYVGGGLVLVAALLLLSGSLRASRVAATAGAARRALDAGAPFYLLGLSFLLVGTTIGMGLYWGWDATVLRLAEPREVHVHAQGFGFVGLVLAGLLVDFHEPLTGRAFAWPRALPRVRVALGLGAAGLVAGPWIPLMPVLGAGLALYLAGTVVLLASVATSLRARSAPRLPQAQLLLSYTWILVPILLTPFIVMRMWGLSEARVGVMAPGVLVYGWMLQAAFVLLPLAVARALGSRPRGSPAANGVVLVGLNAGAILGWASIAWTEHAAALQAGAYALWALALVPFVIVLGRAMAPAADEAQTRFAM